MFCTRCGHDVDEHDRFCGRCGHALAESPRAAARAAGGWQESVDYRFILHHPEVQELISAAAGRQAGGMTAEQFLSAAQPLLGAAGVAVPLDVVAGLAQPLYAKLGVRTGKESSAHFQSPPGRVIAAVLCSLAGRGQALESMEQASDGCVLTAKLPSSVWAFGGTLIVTIEADEAGTQVAAATSIPGQIYDWGHSKRVLSALLQDVPAYLSLQP